VIRKLIVAVVRFALRIYFRHIEVVGLEHVPRDSPVQRNSYASIEFIFVGPSDTFWYCG